MFEYFTQDTRYRRDTAFAPGHDTLSGSSTSDTGYHPLLQDLKHDTKHNGKTPPEHDLAHQTQGQASGTSDRIPHMITQGQAAVYHFQGLFSCRNENAQRMLHI